MHGEGIATEHGPGVGRQKAHDGDPQARAQREHPVVRKQDDRAFGQFPRRLSVVGLVQGRRLEPGQGRLGGPVRVQQPQCALLSQHAPDGAVHQARVDPTGPDKAQQFLSVRVDIG